MLWLDILVFKVENAEQKSPEQFKLKSNFRVLFTLRETTTHVELEVMLIFANRSCFCLWRWTETEKNYSYPHSGFFPPSRTAKANPTEKWKWNSNEFQLRPKLRSIMRELFNIKTVNQSWRGMRVRNTENLKSFPCKASPAFCPVRDSRPSGKHNIKYFQIKQKILTVLFTGSEHAANQFPLSAGTCRLYRIGWVGQTGITFWVNDVGLPTHSYRKLDD